MHYCLGQWGSMNVHAHIMHKFMHGDFWVKGDLARGTLRA